MSDPFANARPLDRASLAGRSGIEVTAPPVRIVHLGLGAFHRAHQAWYTARADERGEWGIAAFTGRSPTAAAELAPQDGLFTLVERSADGDAFAIIPSIAEARDGADLIRFAELMADSSVAIVTLTITEAGYRLDAAGRVDRQDPQVVADLARLAALTSDELPTAGDGAPETSLGRLVLGLEARRRSGAGPIAVVPCDNMPGNGALVGAAVAELATEAGPPLAEWIERNVSFVSTSVDRITPRTTPEDLDLVARQTGWRDAAAVVTEPFSDWVLSGAFPAGRPRWERAGARFVEDIEPFERRKLWLLNGAHSLLAYSGLLRGHVTVADAIADPQCREWVSELWEEDARHLPEEQLDLPAYCAALLERFGNRRIAHRLEQIGTDGVAKLRVRFPEVVLAERRAGRDAAGAVRALGSWAALVLSGRRLPDSHSAAIDRVLEAPPDQRVAQLLAVVDERVAADPVVVSAVSAVVAEHLG